MQYIIEFDDEPPKRKTTSKAVKKDSKPKTKTAKTKK